MFIYMTNKQKIINDIYILTVQDLGQGKQHLMMPEKKMRP